MSDVYVWSPKNDEAHILFEFLDKGKKVRCLCGDVLPTKKICSCRDQKNTPKSLCFSCREFVKDARY